MITIHAYNTEWPLHPRRVGLLLWHNALSVSLAGERGKGNNSSYQRVRLMGFLEHWQSNVGVGAWSMAMAAI